MDTNMREMSLEHKQTFLKAMQVLNNFIQKRKHSDLMNSTRLRVVMPAGEEVEILTAADAQKCKDRIQAMLDMERLYSR